MSLVPIPNLPAAISLTGAEMLEAVQAGTSVRVTAAQIANQIYTPASITLVNVAELQVATIASLPVTAVLIEGETAAGDGGGGMYVVDPTDSTSVFDYPFVIVDASGRRWKPADAANVVLAELASTTPGSGSDLVANADRSFATIAALLAYPTPSLAAGRTLVASVQEYATGNGGGGGQLRWQANSNQTPTLGNFFNPTGNTGAGRWVRIKDELWMEDFGCIGDGITLNDTPMQAFFSYITAAAGGNASGIGGRFGGGVFNISQSLNAQVSYGWKLTGISKLGSYINMVTDNTPHFLFQDNGDWGFEFDSFSLSWTNNQPASNTSACCMLFDNASPGANNFNFVATNLNCQNGFRFLSETPANEGAVWGWNLDLLTMQNMSGGAVVLNPAPSLGQPNWKIGKLYVQAQRVAATEYIIDVTGSDSFSVDSVEVNNSTNGCGIIRCASGGIGRIGTIKTEVVNVVAGNVPLCDFGNLNIDIQAMEMISINVAAGSSAVTLISGGSVSRVKIGKYNVNFGLTPIVGKVYIAGGFSNGINSTCRFGSAVGIIGTPNCWLTNYPGSVANQGVVVEDWIERHMSANIGDNNATFQIGVNPPVFRYNTNFTGDHTLQMLDVIGGNDSNLIDSLEFTVSVNCPTPAHTLTIIKASADGGGTIASLAATNGTITIKPFRIDGWQPINYAVWTTQTP